MSRRSNWIPGPWAYVFNRTGIPIIPFGFARRLTLPFADLSHALLKSARERVRRNYARILGRGVDDPLVQRLSRDCFRHFGLYIMEMIHVQGWDTESILERLDIEGEEHFAAAESYGRGIIFTSAHMGSAEIAATLAVLNGYRITALTERLRPKFIMDWARACRSRIGITLLTPTNSGINLLRALRKREMVALVVDVGIDQGGGVPVTFFGQESVFPVAPARLARLSGAPIIFGLAVRKPGGRYLAYVSPPILSNRDLEPEEDARQITRRIVDIFEGFVRRHPGQWYVFREMWPEDGRPLPERTPL
jgi:KDO2-lipid IV(A) lauroyltransferase